MATQTKNTQTTLPPKRGKIKAQIFESLVKTVKSTVTSIAGGGAPDSGESTSAANTAPPSGYNSDGNPQA